MLQTKKQTSEAKERNGQRSGAEELHLNEVSECDSCSSIRYLSFLDPARNALS